MSPQPKRGPLQADAENLDSASPSTPPVLEAAGLSRSFGPIEVLSDVSISVRAGEVQAIIGQNPPRPFPLPRRRSAAGHILTLVEAP
jgi:ATPase subunit of ABC transporter with duplicated ATPase domains